MADYRSNGKLLLSGEYLVLYGATALVLPLKYGQTLTVQTVEKKEAFIYWTAHQAGSCWFQLKMGKADLNIRETTDYKTAIDLQRIFAFIKENNPEKFAGPTSLLFETELEFDRNWGWGSSSTLIVNLARWAGMDPFVFLKHNYEGSGYDLAAATISGPFQYKLGVSQPEVKPVFFHPHFSEHLYFAYLGNKQKSAFEVKRYMTLPLPGQEIIDRISVITAKIVKSSTLDEFNELVEEHELLISAHIKMKRIKASHFSDFPGKVKSLGAWGGDFVLISCDRGLDYIKQYLENKQITTFFSFDEVTLHEK